MKVRLSPVGSGAFLRVPPDCAVFGAGLSCSAKAVCVHRARRSKRKRTGNAGLSDAWHKARSEATSARVGVIVLRLRCQNGSERRSS